VLDDYADLMAACAANAHAFDISARRGGPVTFSAGDIYCPACGGPRRVTILQVTPFRGGLGYLATDDASPDAIAIQLAPALFVFTCLQSGTRFTALLFTGPDGFELAVFPSVRGGLSTPHTPPAIGYYLDQAQRAQSVGANSAAVAMYRAALEQVLFEQGYTKRMLGPKIEQLDGALANGTAPAWARDLDPGFLSVIKRLGDAAIHPGEGDVSKQAVLHRALLRQISTTFTELLYLAYEREHERTERLTELEEAQKQFEH
jgi:hypothetical protein